MGLGGISRLNLATLECCYLRANCNVGKAGEVIHTVSIEIGEAEENRSSLPL